MVKRTSVLLIVLLVFAVVLASQAEARAPVRQPPASVKEISSPSPSAYIGLNSGTLGEKRNQSEIPGTTSFLLAESVQSLYWIKSSQSKRQTLSFIRNGHGPKFATSCEDKPVQQGGKTGLTILCSLWGSLSSLSPPDLILRL
jgi:hypothetical protein